MNADPLTQNRPYQGYPYVNPITIDAPSVSAADAARWQNLPRKPVTHPTPRPAEETSSISGQCPPDTQKLEDPPVIYIDIPDDNYTSEQGSSEVISESVQTNTQDTDQHRRKSREYQPVVYIDIPDTSEQQTSTDDTRQRNGDFVEETIFYDQFEDRRIDVNRSEGSASRSENSSPERPRIVLPSYTAEGSSNTQNPQSRVPPFLSKETYIYTPPADDGLRLSPLPVSSPPGFPDPPPAYTEVDVTRIPEQPRTQVIVPGHSTVVTSNPNRKLLLCPYCGQRVLTLVVRESGTLTHVLGLIFLIAFFPITVCVYCTDWCKYRNHYCPQCNQLIAYEVPILCQDMVYNNV